MLDGLSINDTHAKQRTRIRPCIPERARCVVRVGYTLGGGPDEMRKRGRGRSAEATAAYGGI
jgi:hypothetical protein